MNDLSKNRIKIMGEMQINEWLNIGDGLSILRVPYGWIYQFTDAKRSESVFVPDLSESKYIWIENPAFSTGELLCRTT